MHSAQIQCINTRRHRMNTKEKYTISEATALLGFGSRSTINKRTKGQGGEAISYELDEDGRKVISIVELQRVFPDRVKQALGGNTDTQNTSSQHSTKAQSNTAKNTTNTVWLVEKVELLEELLVKEQAERVREHQEAQVREKKGEGREERLQDQISELTRTLSQQTRLLEHHQKVETENNDKGPNNPANKILQATSSELSNTLKLAGFASIAMIILLILAYFYQNQNVQLLKLEKVIPKKSEIQKKKPATRTSLVKSLNRAYKNYTPILL